jgi:hypothetical protein
LRRILLAGAGTALAASLALTGSTAALAAGARASTAGSFTVSGTVTGASGPVRVLLYAWPSAAVVRSLRPGQRVPLRPLGEQTTSTGQYALNVNPAMLPRGIVNMEVTAFGGGSMTAHSFTRDHVATSGGTVLATPFGPAQMAPQVASLRLPATAPPPPLCLSPELFFQRNLGAKNVVVGATYSKAANITTKFSYNVDQSSSLGVGMSASTAFANFSESGTYGISSTAGEDFAPFHGVGSHSHQTQFRYGLYRWRCAAPHAGSYWANYQTQPFDYAGGARSPGANPNFRATFCQLQETNSTFHLSRTAAYTFSGGVSISSVIGINLSAQTGYDQGASLSYTVTRGPARWLCGKNNNPGGANPPAGLIVAH